MVVLSQLVDLVANSLSIMHSGDTVHGDLTTSNMMLKPRISMEKQMAGIKTLSVNELVATGSIGDLYLIDFGLA